MKDQTYFNLVLGVAVALVLILAAVSFLVAPAAVAPKRASAGGQTVPTVYRNLTISYSAATGGFEYNVAQLLVPLHVRVIFTITNFDPSVATVPSASDANVVGIDGGMMQMAAGGGHVSVGAIPASDVSHTFSMSNMYYQLNVPIPRADGSGSPSIVTFSEVFNIPGTFTWGCVVLCGPPDMRAPDSMFGSLTAS